MLNSVLFFVLSYWLCIPLYSMQELNEIEHYRCSSSCTQEEKICIGTFLCGTTMCGLMIANPTLIIFNNIFSCPVGSYFCYQCARTFCCSANHRRNSNPLMQVNERLDISRNYIAIQYPYTRKPTHIAIPDNQK